MLPKKPNALISSSWRMTCAELLLLTAIFVGCATPQQSNYNRPMAQEVLAQISVGMSDQDLRQILGSPTIVDSFHPNLMVYLFVDPMTKAPWQATITLDQDRKVLQVSSRLANIAH